LQPFQKKRLRLVLIYTVMGGMVAVIVTDYIQFIVLSIGLGLGVYFCLSLENLGWSNMTAALATHRGEAAFNPVAEGGYGWNWVGFNLLVFFAAFICWAPEATRALTAKDSRTTRRTFLFAGPGLFIRLAIPAFLAVAAFCFVSQDAQLTAHFFPEGLSGKAAHAEQAMPMLLGQIVPTGLLGLLVAGFMAAFMSTHDSYLLAWSSVITRDIIVPLRGREIPDKQQITITRVTVVLIGIFLLVWGVWYPLPASVWNYMAITGTVYVSGAVTVLIGGLYWKRASRAGAICALLAGLISLGGLAIERVQAIVGDWLTTVHLGFFNFLFCIVVFVVVSLLVPDKKRE
jgi:SSS family solute:Na+ symporter